MEFPGTMEQGWGRAEPGHMCKAAARHPVHSIIRKEPSPGHNHHKPQTAIYKCGEFGETENALPQMHSPPPPWFLNPCGFQGKLNPYVSGSFTLNSSKCNFATSS